MEPSIPNNCTSYRNNMQSIPVGIGNSHFVVLGNRLRLGFVAGVVVLKAVHRFFVHLINPRRVDIVRLEQLATAQVALAH